MAGKIRLIETDHRGNRQVYEAPGQEGTHNDDYAVHPTPIIFENGFTDAYSKTWRA